MGITGIRAGPLFHLKTGRASILPDNLPGARSNAVARRSPRGRRFSGMRQPDRRRVELTNGPAQHPGKERAVKKFDPSGGKIRSEFSQASVQRFEETRRAAVTVVQVMQVGFNDRHR